MPEGLDMCNEDTILKYFLTCRDYENAYHSGLTGKRIEEQVKVYKSHRRVFEA